MTEIYLEKDGNRYTAVCRGHATGSEAACAAVSALSYTLAGYLRNLPYYAEIALERLESGNVRIEFLHDGTFVSELICDTVFDMICVGFLQLSKSYPEQIKADVKEIE